MHAGRVLFVRELDPKKCLFVTDSAHSVDARRSRARELDPKKSLLSLAARIQLMRADRVLFVRELDPKKFLFVTDSARSADARRSRTWQGPQAPPQRGRRLNLVTN